MYRYFVWVVLVMMFALCSTEDGHLYGTQLKEITLLDKSGEIMTQTRYDYNENRNLVTIRYPLATSCNGDIVIRYNQTKRVSFVGNDSMVYEDGHLAKTYYVGEDTTYINAEFRIENEQLKEKIIYHRFYVLCGGPNPPIIDTTSVFYEYDAVGNVSKTSHSPSRIIFLPVINSSSLYYDAEFSHDSKVSPFADFPDEIKFILFLNSGPNNVIGVDYGNQTTDEIEYQYNLDNLPITSKPTASSYTTLFKYY
jgi:YD repeat-containing protein